MAGRLYDRLAARLGDDQVFMDVDAIAPGLDFTEVIAEAVSTCELLLAIIGPRWLNATDEEGRRRLDDPNDFVRLEIETALERDIRVIPVLVEDARLPRAGDLPASLVKLVRLQAVELSHSRFHADTGRLLNVLEVTLADAQARREEAAKAAREADELVRREAEARVARDAEEQVPREAEERKLSVIEEAAQKLRSGNPSAIASAETALRGLASDTSLSVAQAAARLLADWEAENQAQREAEARAKAQREAEAKAKAQREAEAKAKAQREAEAKAQAQREAEAKAQREANEYRIAARGSIPGRLERNRTISSRQRTAPQPSHLPDTAVPTRRQEAIGRKVTTAKPQWLVGLTFLMLIVIVAVYVVLRNGDNGQPASEGFTGPIKQGGAIRFAADGPTGFNVNTSKDAFSAVWNIVINMYPQPFHVQPDFTVKLDDTFLVSAEQTSTDPQTIVYRINQGAVWSDGVPVNADDFIYLWKNSNGSIKSNDIASITGYDQIRSVVGSDGGKTVTVVFQTPFADWKGLFTGILPSHYVKKQPGTWNSGLDKNPEKIPSAGPFLVKDYTSGQSLTMVRNDKYWGHKAYLDEIVYRFLPASTTPAAALQNNEVDLIYPQPQLDQVQQVKALPDVTSEVNLGLNFEHLDFNFKNQHLRDLRVRQAIATGLNIQQLVDRTVKPFTDKAQPLGNRIWVTGQPEYQDHFGQYGKGDVAGAQELLQEAGYSRDADGVYAKDGKKLSLRFSTTTGNRIRENQAELVQTQMKEVGIDIKITNAGPTKLFVEWLPKGNFDIVNFAWISSPFVISASQPLYETNSGSNYGGYSNAKVDELFKEAVSETEEAKKAKLGNQIDQQLTADMATIPLYTKPTFLAFRKEFVNIGDNATQEGPFWNAGTWGQKG
jgi:peptide/nickel transport system substrate-binding protein